jgi:hypothetical protein
MVVIAVAAATIMGLIVIGDRYEKQIGDRYEKQHDAQMVLNCLGENEFAAAMGVAFGDEVPRNLRACQALVREVKR